MLSSSITAHLIGSAVVSGAVLMSSMSDGWLCGWLPLVKDKATSHRPAASPLGLEDVVEREANRTGKLSQSSDVSLGEVYVRMRACANLNWLNQRKLRGRQRMWMANLEAPVSIGDLLPPPEETLLEAGPAENWVLFIVLREAVDLKSMDLNGKSDPYMIFCCGDNKATSTHKNKTLSPIWDERLALQLQNAATDVVRVEYWDKDVGSGDDKAADVRIEMGQLIEGTMVKDWLVLHDAKGKACGKVLVELTLQRNIGIADLDLASPPPHLLLKVQLQHGRKLMAMDSNLFKRGGATSDPYIIFNFGLRTHTQTAKSEIKMKTLDPVWDQSFEFVVHDADTELAAGLELQCWDWDQVGSDDAMGDSVVALTDLKVGDKWRQRVVTLGNAKTGEIIIELQLQVHPKWLELHPHEEVEAEADVEADVEAEPEPEPEPPRTAGSLLLRLRQLFNSYDGSAIEPLVSSPSADAIAALRSAKADAVGDAVVKLRLRDVERETSAHEKGLHPIWDEGFDLPVTSIETDELILELVSSGKLSLRRPVATARLAISDLSVGELSSVLLRLESDGANAKPVGAMLVDALLLPERPKAVPPLALQPMWLLRIELKHGKRLPAMDRGKTSDPFVTLRLRGVEHKSSVKPKTLDPVWHEKFEFQIWDDVELEHGLVAVQLWEHDTIKNRRVGDSEVATASFSEGVPVRRDLKLANAPSGSLLLQVELVRNDEYAKQRRLLATEGIGADYQEPPRRVVEQPTNGALDQPLRSAILRVRVRKARGLAVRDLSSVVASASSDPFVRLSMGRQVFRTKSIKSSLEPVWDEQFEFQIEDLATDYLLLECWDADAVSADDRMGEARIELGELEVEQRTPTWLKLERVASGEVLVDLTLLGAGGQLAEVPAIPVRKQHRLSTA